MDFTQITKFLDAGSTGILVSLVLSLISFVSERKRSEKQATIDDYKEWLRSKKHKDILNGQDNILAAIENQKEHTQLINNFIRTVIYQLENHTEILNEIVEHTNLLPDMNSKIYLDLIPLL